MKDLQLSESWINWALISLVQAKEVAGNDLVYYEELCFDCQQAAEKAIYDPEKDP